jgi:hypothetical protein
MNYALYLGHSPKCDYLGFEVNDTMHWIPISLSTLAKWRLLFQCLSILQLIVNSLYL